MRVKEKVESHYKNFNIRSYSPTRGKTASSSRRSSLKISLNLGRSIRQKSNDKSNHDYVPSIQMGYDERTDATLSSARHDRLQKRRTEKGRKRWSVFF
ncbi:Hypothetical predicted protein [Mytilus galloprovincialis]|uniref:Uncharacterized protein n=1 Tax=Mytilus galloprovincialis TaxID=29158 RepID=A0A8B6EYS8_MYTGA|nr:Hypothetical predicted protein [Mytilus galloprovincialis]